MNYHKSFIPAHSFQYFAIINNAVMIIYVQKTMMISELQHHI